MAFYKAPVRDARFLLREVFAIERYAALPGFDRLAPDLLDAILEGAARFAEEVVAPLNAPGDAAGAVWHRDGSVTVPEGFGAARRQLHAAGWPGLALPEALGGQGLPKVLQFVVGEFLNGASPSFMMMAGFSHGDVTLLEACASPALREAYVPRIAAGEWATTMELTEPQAGSDLGLIRTQAVPRPDGSYALTGTKIFISGGQHDLTENIVHLVLARTPGAPAGPKGISLFLVPGRLPAADGGPGARNAIRCIGIEHKMGLRASPTCTMHYEEATGWLVGEEHRGLAGMFILMNAARLSVGIGALAIAHAAYVNAADYALERRQGRAPAAPALPNADADFLVAHPDVRRMLMDAKAATEGLRALAVWCGLLLDLAAVAPDAHERQRSADLLDLLTPILKGYGTQIGFDVTVAMQQVWGGHGYIVDNGMEQFVRDIRITMIYEGTNGIQARDLAQRKIRLNDGRALRAFTETLAEEIAAARGEPAVRPLADALEGAAGDLKAATDWLTRNADRDPNAIAAASFHYLHIAGIVTLGLMWLRIARTAARTLGETPGDAPFYEAKLATARHFAQSFLPDTAALLRKIEAGPDALMALSPEQFAAA